MKARLSFDEDGSLDTETCENCAGLHEENERYRKMIKLLAMEAKITNQE